MGRNKNTKVSKVHKVGKTKPRDEKFSRLSNVSKPISKQNAHQRKRQTNEWTRNKVTEIDSTLALLRQSSPASFVQKRTKEQDSQDNNNEEKREENMELSPGENDVKMNEGETKTTRAIQDL